MGEKVIKTVALNLHHEKNNLNFGTDIRSYETGRLEWRSRGKTITKKACNVDLSKMSGMVVGKGQTYITHYYTQKTLIRKPTLDPIKPEGGDATQGINYDKNEMCILS